jgi:hypothetical protein
MRTTPKPFVFVLMPFSADFKDTYELVIKPVAEEVGAYAERVDEQIFSGSVLERIYHQISGADIVVAEMSGRNANVFYEVGYAHALGKTTVLLTKNADDIPFDLKHYSHIVYSGSLVTARDELTRVLRFHLQNPDRVASPGAALTLMQDGRPVVMHRNFYWQFERLRASSFSTASLDFVFFNNPRTSSESLVFSLALETPRTIESVAIDEEKQARKALISPTRTLHKFAKRFAISPGEHEPFRLLLSVDKSHATGRGEFELNLRALLPSIAVSFPFTATFSVKVGDA